MERSGQTYIVAIEAGLTNMQENKFKLLVLINRNAFIPEIENNAGRRLQTSTQFPFKTDSYILLPISIIETSPEKTISKREK